MSQTVLQPPAAIPEPAPAPGAPRPPLNDTGLSGWALVGLLFGGLVLFFALLTAMLVIIEHNSSSSSPSSGAAATNATSGTTAGTAGPASATVMLSEFSITPADVTLAPGGSSRP